MRNSDKSVIDIKDMIRQLPAPSRELFERIFRVSVTTGRLNPTEFMFPWLEKQFGSLQAVVSQRIVRITNIVTMEGSIFNELRARRPADYGNDKDSGLEAAIEETIGDPFCSPLDRTPEDVFGRLRGEYCTTASSVAKFEGFHGVVVFDEHNPLVLSQERVADYIETALAWAQAAHREDQRARYFLLLWNCIWRSGASITHGHAQVVLGRDMHYARVEHLRRAAHDYWEAYGLDYFEDFYEAHAALGLALENGGTRIMAHLTPIKEREVLLISRELDDDFKDSLYRVLDAYLHGMGVTSFNLAVYLRPMGDHNEVWKEFPVMGRLVDRGDPTSRTADIGAIDLYGCSQVVADPFQVVSSLLESFPQPCAEGAW